MVRPGKVCDNRRSRVALGNMQDVLLQDALATEPAHVAVISYFQDMPADVVGVTSQETFDVVTIDGHASVETELTADRREPAQVSKTDLALRRNVGTILALDQQTASERRQNPVSSALCQADHVPERIPCKLVRSITEPIHRQIESRTHLLS